MPAFIDLTGQRFGRWTVLSRAEDYRRGIPQWLCRCDCGNQGVVRASILRAGKSRSCGCLNLEIRRDICLKRNTKHGMSQRGKRTRAYITWCNISRRMQTGAKWQPPVCERWRSFENFLADMGEPPSEEHSIDRIDGTLGYSPDNCRWATMKEQQNNRLNNRRLICFGRTMTLQQWAEETGLKRETIARRLDDLGWSIEEALTRKPSPLPR